jgi:hypothetical protein
MRTKSLLLTAALIAAGVGVSQAQVYSVNAVGYINVVNKPGYNIIANQLINSNSTVAALFPNVPGGTTILKWLGTGFSVNAYDSDFAEWQDPNQTLAPGEAAFFLNPTTTNVTVTFVGDVPQGNLTNGVPQNFSLKSSIVPQGGSLQGNLAYVPTGGDQVLRWVNNYPASSGYAIHSYDADFGEWDVEPGTGSLGPIRVGEGFFIKRAAAGAGQWVRQFSVN